MRERFGNESGGVTVLVATVVASLLLIGSIALVVDSGVVYLERRAVANAAQSAALALARECVTDPRNCIRSTMPQDLANANSPDSLTAVVEICVNGKTITQANCAATTPSTIDCSAVPVTESQWVRVRTQSKSQIPEVGVETFFSQNRNETLKACAQARWGNAASASSFTPFGISICEWARNKSGILREYTTNNGVAPCSWTFADMNGETTTATGISGWVALDLMSTSIPASARASVACPNPATESGAYLRVGYELSQITKSQSSQDYCGNGNLASKMNQWLERTLYIPLVSTPKLSGQATVHRIEAFAGFKLLGYALLRGQGNASTTGGNFPNGNWCPNNTSCIYGEFVSTFSPNSEVNTDPNVPQVGLQAIQLFQDYEQ